MGPGIHTSRSGVVDEQVDLQLGAGLVDAPVKVGHALGGQHVIVVRTQPQKAML